MTSIQQPLSRQNIICGVLIALLCCIISILLPKLWYNKANISLEGVFLISRLTIWLALIAIFFYAIKIEKQPMLLWKESSYSFGMYIVSIVAVLATIFFGLIIINLVVKTIDPTLNNSSKRLEDMLAIFKQNRFLLILTAITAGITEEMIFRGYLLPRFQLLFKNNYVPIILSSVLFGLMHIGYGTFMQVLGPIFMGGIFAIYYQKYRNIKVIIICHFLWDLLALLYRINLKQHLPVHLF